MAQTAGWTDEAWEKAVADEEKQIMDEQDHELWEAELRGRRQFLEGMKKIAESSWGRLGEHQESSYLDGEQHWLHEGALWNRE